MNKLTLATLVATSVTALAACEQKAPEVDLFAAQRSFDTADANKDGVISQHEASSVANLDFATADTDKNAALSPEEFQVALATTSPPRG